MMKLKDAEPGTLFQTASGAIALKTEYRTFNGGRDPDCYLLGSGEAAHVGGDNAEVEPLDVADLRTRLTAAEKFNAGARLDCDALRKELEARDGQLAAAEKRCEEWREKARVTSRNNSALSDENARLLAVVEPLPKDQELKPGTDLDVILAEKLFGWELLPQDGHFGFEPGQTDRTYANHVRAWSTANYLAHEVIAALEAHELAKGERRWLSIEIERYTDYTGDTYWVVTIITMDGRWTATHETFPGAVALAAVAALEGGDAE